MLIRVVAGWDEHYHEAQPIMLDGEPVVVVCYH